MDTLSALWLGIFLPQALAQWKCWVGCRPPAPYWPLGFLLFIDPGFLFCKLTSQLLGLWDWIYLNGVCWPQSSLSDAFGPVSKELSGDAAIVAVYLEMILWDHAVLVGAKVRVYPKSAGWPVGSPGLLCVRWFSLICITHCPFLSPHFPHGDPGCQRR